MMKRCISVCLLVLLFLTGISAAATINVPLDYSTIQAAIDAAVVGDTIIVAASGSPYTENIDFKGKDIHVRSDDVDNPANTVISGTGSGSVVTFENGESPLAELSGFTIRNGNATYGGGIECFLSSPTISNCIITNNQALFGGGVDIYMASPVLINCQITGNSAMDGGGINFDTDAVGSPVILDCLISGNSSSGVGAGVNCYKSSPSIENCLIINNTAANKGGAVYLFDSGPTITNCTIIDNIGLDNFGGIYRGSSSGVADIVNSILWNNGDDIYNGDGMTSYSCIEDGDTGTGNIFDDPQWRTGPLGNYYLRQIAAGQLEDSNCVDAGSDLASVFGLDIFTTRTDEGLDSGIVDIGYHYPLSGVLVDYELTTSVDGNNGSIDPNHPSPGEIYRQFAEVWLTATPDEGYEVLAWTGTDDDSSTDANNIVTIDSNEIVAVSFKPVTLYTLTVSAGANGNIEPRRGGDYLVNTVVTVTAIPSEGYQVQAWTGTDDDSTTATTNTVTMTANKNVTVTFELTEYILVTSVDTAGGTGRLLVNGIEESPSVQPTGSVVELTAVPDNPLHVAIWIGTDDDNTILLTNTVTMDGNKDVTVRFYTPKTLYVGGDGGYTRIQDAIDDAVDGDIVEIAAGTYYTSWGFEIDSKAITITSADIDNPAATVIIQEVGESGSVRSAFRFYNVGRSTVLAGLTLRGFGFKAPDGEDGSFDVDDPGAGHGEDGYNAWGGTIGCFNASPVIRNCVIENSRITGGNGGNGDNGQEARPTGFDGGWGGSAFGGGLICWGNSSNPLVINTTFRNCSAISGNGGDGGDGYGDPGEEADGGRGGGWTYGRNSDWYNVSWENDSYTYYTDYSGHGGAVYVGPGSAPEFVDCNFIDNRSEGGLNGICGEGRLELIDEPSIRYRTPNFGGAVYCADGSSAVFRNCNFVDNQADPSTSPNAVSSFVGYGGGIAFDDGANIVFEGCTFNGNTASIGGGMYHSWADPEITDSNFVNNTALHGGGMSFAGGTATITGTSFSGNQATGSGGNGGAINSNGAGAVITDSTVMNNSAIGSGGGIYISNKDVENNATVVIKNCLIVNNISAISGGGISANEYSDPDILNCTIADNTVTGAGSGGGVYASQGNYTIITDSILWGNAAANGNQLAIGTATDPAWVEVKYSDVQGGRGGVYVEEGGTLDWDAATNINDDPLFVTGPLDDYYLSHADINSQTADSPAIDAGSDYASYIEMGNSTTRTDDVFDKGLVDMGYHRAISQIDKCRRCDLVLDGIINFNDYAMLTLEWLNPGCNNGNDWCGGADFTFDGDVEPEDLLYFTDCWLGQDSKAPTPDPAQWQIAPYSSSTTAPYSISMTAAEATDGWGLDVEYFFECVANDVNSGWQPNPNWTDTNLDPNTEYGYQVRVRDVKPYPNVGDWSVIKYAVTGEDTPPSDTTAPTPDPMTWLTEPYEYTTTSIRMVATTATDASGVEYYFECVSDPNHDSGWQDSPIYEATGLTDSGVYTFRVQARDKSANQNATAWSTEVTVDLGAEPLLAPVISPDDPSQTGTSGSYWEHHMFADISSIGGDGSQVYIKFVCTDQDAYSSYWEPISDTGNRTTGSFGFGEITFANNRIDYDVQVGYGAAYGYQRSWKVCVSYSSDGSGEVLCSSTITIDPVQP